MCDSGAVEVEAGSGVFSASWGETGQAASEIRRAAWGTISCAPQLRRPGGPGVTRPGDCVLVHRHSLPYGFVRVTNARIARSQGDNKE